MSSSVTYIFSANSTHKIIVDIGKDSKNKKKIGVYGGVIGVLGGWGTEGNLPVHLPPPMISKL